MTTRRVLALGVSLLVGALVTVAPAATARGVGDPCLARGPVSARALPALESAGCSLVGRTVTEGRLVATIPPVGEGVVGEGVGRHGDVGGLAVSNTGRTVLVGRSHDVGGLGATAASRRRGSPPACQDPAYVLEGHRWGSRLVYRLNLGAKPKRLHTGTVIAQVKAANHNMRTGRNTCHKPRIKTPASRYAGRTHVRPDVMLKGGPTCGSGVRTNIVAFGNLPGDLLGWTCTWYSLRSGLTVGSAIVMDNGGALVTSLPSSCTRKWDFEGALTHEWGHAYGLAHPGPGHANLTMQHELAPCSTYARTLGLGDWLGLDKLYGHRR